MFYDDPKREKVFFGGDFSGRFFPYDPAVHLVRHTPFTGFLNGLLKTEKSDGEIIVYWHKGSRNWMVASWVKEHGLIGIYEILVLNHDPDGTLPCLTPSDVGRLQKQWFHPDTGKENSDIIKSMNRSFKNQKADAAREWIAKNQWYARKVTPVKREQIQEFDIARRHKRLYC